MANWSLTGSGIVVIGVSLEWFVIKGLRLGARLNEENKIH